MTHVYFSTHPTLGNLGDVEGFNPETVPSGYVFVWDSVARKAKFATATPGAGTIYDTTAERLAAVGTVTPGTLASCLEEEGLVWQMNTAGDAWILTNASGVMSYTADFIVADWSGPSGGAYTLSIAAATHGLDTKPSIDAFETTAGPTYTATGVEWLLDSSGNITISVSDVPDGRFAGRIIVHR